MRTLSVAAFLAAFSIAPGSAQPVVPPPTDNSGPVCLRPFDTPHDAIDHTHVVDPSTILFYMRDGTIWKNTLHQPCPGLMFHGFSFVTHQDEICANAQGIQVLVTNQVCVLGGFTRYVPPPKNAASTAP